MENELLKLHILSIAVSGFLMLLTGLLLYLFKEAVSNHIRFFLPVPPIGVAAYIFAYNLFRYHNGSLPNNAWHTVGEVIVATGIATIFFCLFTTAIIAISYFLRGIL